MLALACAAVGAHEPADDAVPASRGWRLGAAVAGVAVDADGRWPVATWPGVLIDGTSPRDMGGRPRLEHATLDVAARFSDAFGAHAAAGWHDRESAHLEAARVQWRRASNAGTLIAQVGRDTVRMGSVIDNAGHFDRFSQMPLARRAVTNGLWTDDGVTLAWRRDVERGLRGLEAGLWRARYFPGSEDDPAPSLQVTAGWDAVEAQAFGARLDPVGRGALARAVGGEGHLHGPPDCAESLRDLVCFDGRSEILGVAVRWQPTGARFAAAAAAMARRERGQLYAQSGAADYRGTVHGGWLDLAWTPAAHWTVALRLERLVPRNRLSGVNATQLAREANLAGGGAVERATLAALRELPGRLTLALEGGRERRETLDTRHVALRLIWRAPTLLQGQWR